ncbi:exodeoxyribonuclease VII large subunit [Chitinophaga terrae (ex Kim and Jung 2007)]|uniref:Exodeoxyribonuclease 7 large subunit n=1 Tax=Chitinophaga terrae (ex Kim and Jung 2007) TaxID=408074 RepID=A0A1H4AQ04_9BACT|nr:exodeoxyribonuclease 7 large subunit [Chitinophaga terrae (ex Kim and Jung 2007)]SEA38010.1 exodeoxyribonuclease VII large subunit [Chitinophaga terrae (ex Kim and Jung 2007)]
MHMFSSIKLSELTGQIQQTLNNAFASQTYWVVADVTNHSFYSQKGYHYFDLVEKDVQGGGIVAKVSAVAWGTGAERIREFEIVTGQQFKNDIHVLVRVAVSFHQIHGLQITLLDIDTNFTVGLLEQQKQATLLRLVTTYPEFIRQSGNRYITRNNQLQMNQVIQRIAVVSSGNSAGYQDFIHTIRNNHFGYSFQVDNYFTVVQGEAQAELVQQRLIDIYNSGIAYDVVVIIRGGGAQTDFLLFDTFLVGRAVARFPIPIITGIGHQKNETIADLMAHTAVKTPTKAAEMIIAHNRMFEEKLTQLRQQIIIRSQQLFSRNLQVLSSLQGGIINTTKDLITAQKENVVAHQHTIAQAAKGMLANKKQDLSAVSGTLLLKPRMVVAKRQNDIAMTIAALQSSGRLYFQRKNSQIAHYVSLCQLMDPAHILKRGFAIIHHNGKIVGNAASISEGAGIEIQMSDARMKATINSKTNEHE